MQTIVLVGNPNAGKTTLFNALTHSTEHTGNWHGVTVEEKRAVMQSGKETYTLIDTPGVYSLTPYSGEEAVTLQTLLQPNVSLVVQVVEGLHWEKSLFLTLELLETGLPLKLVFTYGARVPKQVVENITRLWGVDCFMLTFLRKKYIKQLTAFLKAPIEHKRKPLPWVHKQQTSVPEKAMVSVGVSQAFLQQKWQCGVKEVLPYMHHKPSTMCNNCTYAEMQIITKYRYLDSTLRDIIPPQTPAKKSLGILERVVLSKVWAVPIFLCVILAVFTLTFGKFGVWLSYLMGNFISQTLGPLLMLGVRLVVHTPWLLAFIEQGVIASCANVLSFLPQIVLLSLCMHVLEEVGYLSRVALLFDGALQKIGLQGRSVFSMLMGYGCTTSAVILTRGMPQGCAKNRTLCVLPFTHCSAKMPIFFVISSVFFTQHRVLMVFALYLLSVAFMIIYAYCSSRGETQAQNFILEMPGFRPIRLKSVWQNVCATIKNFVSKVVSVVVLVSCILFVLLNFDTSFTFLQGVQGTSILETIGQKASILLAPMGLNHWAIFASLLCGVVAKELVLSSLALANGVVQGGVLTFLASSLQNPQMPVSFTPLTSVVFLLFVAFYMPCIATITMIRKEAGKRLMWKSILVPFVTTYILCTLVYQVGRVYQQGNKTLAVLWAIFIALVGVCMVRYYSKIKTYMRKHKPCKKGSSCTCGEICGKSCGF